MIKFKVYNIKCYISNKGLITDKTEHNAFKESGRYYIYPYSQIFSLFDLINKKLETKQYISFNMYSCNQKSDKTIIGETWCKVGDYKKSRAKLIKILKSQIPNMIKIKKELENDLRISSNKLKEYKRGLSIFINKSNKIKK